MRPRGRVDISAHVYGLLLIIWGNCDVRGARIEQNMYLMEPRTKNKAVICLCKYTMMYQTQQNFIVLIIVLGFVTQKTTYKRQSIYYITYLRNKIWKLLQKRRNY